MTLWCMKNRKESLEDLELKLKSMKLYHGDHSSMKQLWDKQSHSEWI